MTTVAAPPDVRVDRHLPTTRRWPASRLHRWMLRVSLGIPYMWVAVIAQHRGIVSEPNERLHAMGDVIEWGSDDLSFLDQVYPPIPAAMASLLPDGAIWSGLVGAVCGGIVLQVLWERLHLRDVPPLLTGLLLASVGAIPAFLYSTTQDLAAFVGLALFAMAMAGLLRFAVDGDTEGGFQCGLALGVAAMVDPATIVFAICFGLAAPLVAWRRYRALDGAVAATMTVVLFPPLAAFLGWAFIEWTFTGGVFESLGTREEFLAFPGGAWATIGREITALGARLVATPVFVVAAILIARRRPIALGGQFVALAAILTTQILGINLGVGQGVLILASIGVATVEAAPGRRAQIVLGVAACAQLPLQWYPWRTSTAVTDFVEHLVR